MSKAFVDIPKDVINSWKPHGLPDNEFRLIGQLLKKAAAVAEKTFIGGSFLTPLALRFDFLKDSRYSYDRSCMFLSFPYFAIAEPREKRTFQKGDKVHPVRALLQSDHRLIDTTKRDNDQIIKILQETTLNQYINGPKEDVVHLSHKPVSQLIHVPQLWTLILGSSSHIHTLSDGGRANRKQAKSPPLDPSANKLYWALRSSSS